MAEFDVTVVGSGPNGLAAAVTAARAGLAVRLIEGAEQLGGGVRTGELTLPGFRHDICSAVHPAGIASPFFRAIGLDVDWIVPELSYAHPFADGSAALAWRDLERTAGGLGRDGEAWRRLLGPLVDRIGGVVDFTGGQLLRIPRDLRAAVSFGLRSLEQGSPVWNARFSGRDAKALLTGAMAHAPGGMPSLASAGAGLLLAAHAHAAGWAFPRGGSQAIADAMVADLLAHGGTIEPGRFIGSLAELEPTRVTLLDTAPDLLMTADLPSGYARALRRFRRGPGIAKVDFALSAPVPWASPEVGLAPTVHLGGRRSDIAAAERQVMAGRMPRHPYVLITQPSVLDASRAPAGQHTLWAYTHVPRDSDWDATQLITAEVERYAPGFRDTVLASASRSAAEVGRLNPNDIGGDIYGGALTMTQLVRRPVLSTTPWRTPLPGVYLCSAATPPGPAVHGMNGWNAARLALRERFGIRALPLVY